MPDELRSAYAVLGLQPGAPLQEVKQQFKILVRRWHPDRFANDPQGKTEANDRLRVINHAYSTIVQSSVVDVIPPVRRDPWPPNPVAQDASAAEHTPPPVGPPLTRAEIDAMIDAFGGHRPRKSLREQIRDDPWNRGLSLAVVGLYILVDAVQTWNHPWSRLAGSRFQMPLSGPGPVMASVVGSMLWTVPLVWVIWYADAFSKKIAWLFLAVFAVLLPLFVAMMRR